MRPLHQSPGKGGRKAGTYIIPRMKLMASARALAVPLISLVVAGCASADDEVEAGKEAPSDAMPDGYSFANWRPARNSSLLSNSGDCSICTNSCRHASPYEETWDSSTSQQTDCCMTPSVKDLEAVVHERQGMMETGWS